MTVRSVDLSGTYRISAITAARITLQNPATLNPAWYVGDLDGAGTTTIAQNLTMRRVNSDQAVNLDGAYTIDTVTPTQVTLLAPSGVTTDWGRLASFLFSRTSPLSASIAGRDTKWIGPFIVEDPEATLLVANVLALGGLFEDDGKRVQGLNVAFEIQATPVDITDTPIGATQTFVSMVENLDGLGEKTSKDLKAKTLVCALATPGRHSVRARRTTPYDYNFKGTVTDEIKWQDLYSMGPVDQPDFGNVTTVRTRTFATQGALALKERKLNMLVTRKIPLWTGGVAFSAVTATKNAAEIFVEVCRDPLLGNRPLIDIDIAGIHAAVDDVGDYFVDAAASEFGFTFDQDNTSFEEMAQAIGTAVFCVPYRQGSTIKLLFERPTGDSTMLFNHRNKVPGSETRGIRFGTLNDNDGIELEYVDGSDKDTPATIYLPADRSALKPRKVTAHGVRSYRQAYWLAWREFNKLLWQNGGVEFEALSEAAPSIRGERVLVADNTRADTQDGEVMDQAGLILTLSQPVDMSDPAGYTILLQLPDATVESIPVTPGPDPDRTDQVVLGRAPAVALALDPALYARATYQLVSNASPRSSAFLLTEKSPNENGTYAMQAVNYSSLYYQNDSLWLWLPFLDASFVDHSAYSRDGTAVAGATTVVDGARGKRTYSGAAGRSVTFPAFNPPAASYTKAVWVKRDDLGSAGGILQSANEIFGFAGASLQAGHAAAVVSVPWPDATDWHHAAVVWDEAADTMSLYLDAALVDEETGAAIAPRAAAQLTAFSGLAGRADDLRLINRPLSPEEILELYRSTRL